MDPKTAMISDYKFVQDLTGTEFHSALFPLGALGSGTTMTGVIAFDDPGASCEFQLRAAITVD